MKKNDIYARTLTSFESGTIIDTDNVGFLFVVSVRTQAGGSGRLKYQVTQQTVEGLARKPYTASPVPKGDLWLFHVTSRSRRFSHFLVTEHAQRSFMNQYGYSVMFSMHLRSVTVSERARNLTSNVLIDSIIFARTSIYIIKSQKQ